MGFVATFLKNFLYLLGGYTSYTQNNTSDISTSFSARPPLIPRKGINHKLRDTLSVPFSGPDQDGDENYRLYKLNAETEKVQLLTDTEGVRVRLVAAHRDYPDTLYIGLNNRDPRYHDIYHLNISTGEKTLFFTNIEGFRDFSIHILRHDFDIGFVFDHKLNLRLASKQASDAGTNYYTPIWDSESGNVTAWELYRHVKFEDDYTTGISGFDITNTKMYWIDSEGRDLAALVLRDFNNYTNILETIYEPKKSDVSAIISDPLLYIPLAVYENYRRPEMTILNDSIADDFQYLQSLDKTGHDNPLVYDNRAVKYYYYDRGQGKAVYLFDSRKGMILKLRDTISQVDTHDDPKALSEYKLTKMHTVEVKTRDGYTQVCYLSVPLENDPLGTGHTLKPGPLIIFPHGGPHARDSWGYSRSAQLWANRGYAVLQCNYRGSTGLKIPSLFSRNSWITHTDAAEWAIKNGIADRNRIAIYGGSYGGYSALVGVTFTPDFFTCSVDIVGPSNLITLLETIPPYWETARKSLEKRIGGTPRTKKGRAYLKSRSPLFFADKIKVPLLIAQGARDPRVKKNESDQIYEAMKKRQIPVTYLLFPNEGHGFARPENNIAFITKAEKFLADCLGGRAEPKGEDSDGTSLQIVHEGAFE